MNKENLKTYAALAVVLCAGAFALFLFFKYVYVTYYTFLSMIKSIEMEDFMMRKTYEKDSI